MLPHTLDILRVKNGEGVVRGFPTAFYVRTFLVGSTYFLLILVLVAYSRSSEISHNFPSRQYDYITLRSLLIVALVHHLVFGRQVMITIFFTLTQQKTLFFCGLSIGLGTFPAVWSVQ